jgi:hypothetical protein
VAGATRLGLYNLALGSVLGERQLASLSENRAPRRYLDVAWNGPPGAVTTLLSMGQWRFAQRTVKMDADAGLTTGFGYRYAFAAPTDLVRTTRLCADEFFNVPLETYEEENGIYYAAITPFYLSYVSNDTNYGGDLSKWPPNFVQFAKHWLAEQILASLTGNKTDRAELAKETQTLLTRAQATDAMEQATKYPPSGTWVNARMRGRSSGGWSDRGSRSQLIG